jgi:signal transduction histidine kinase
LVDQGIPIGELRVTPRVGERTLSRADHRLIEDLAAHAGVAAHAVQLTRELQRARARLVTTREEERRRLRRDLHDGLGPVLASQALTIDAARTVLPTDPAAADALLAALKAQGQQAIADVRQVIEALRPPALDALGLVAAIRQAAAAYDRTGLQVTVAAPASLPPLPAAVEVAAYRIVQEALTNVVRHAGARVCAVVLTLTDDERVLELTITDDGGGLPADHRQGVGLATMRERAEELGGTCVVGARPGGGVQVQARLPLPRAGEA